MSSGYSPWINRVLLYHIPWLYIKCGEGNYHPRWRSRVCLCDDSCDLVDMKTGKRYVLESRHNQTVNELFDDGPVQAAYFKKREDNIAKHQTYGRGGFRGFPRAPKGSEQPGKE